MYEQNYLNVLCNMHRCFDRTPMSITKQKSVVILLQKIYKQIEGKYMARWVQWNMIFCWAIKSVIFGMSVPNCKMQRLFSCWNVMHWEMRNNKLEEKWMEDLLLLFVYHQHTEHTCIIRQVYSLGAFIIHKFHVICTIQLHTYIWTGIFNFESNFINTVIDYQARSHGILIWKLLRTSTSYKKFNLKILEAFANICKNC